jgi:hypothetical protein
MNDATLKALGELAGYQIAASQHAVIDAAYEANHGEFERLVEYSKTAEAPIGSLISGCRRITAEAEAVANLRTSGDADRAAKRVRSLRNYAVTALPLVPPMDREQVVRDEFRWASPALVAEAVRLAGDKPVEPVENPPA